MVNRRDINFTEGNIAKQLLAFAVPIITGEILQNLYNSVDSLVVGNYVGATALAAIGVCTTLTQLIIGFFNGMSVGSTVVVSKAYGRGDEAEVRKNICCTFTFAVFLGVLLSILGVLLSPALLRIAGASDEVFDTALMYLRIYLIGVLFTVTYNSGAGILRALGDSKSPFLILSVSSVLNIGLDLLFTGWLKKGVAGVALATVISQMLSTALVYRRISLRIGTTCLSVSEMTREGKAVIREAMEIGFWAGLQAALINFSNLFVWRYVNQFSTLQAAGVSIGTRVDKFINLPLKAFGMAMTTFVGQNRGAKNGERIKKGTLCCFLLVMAAWLFFGAIIFAACPVIAKWFNRDETVVETAVGLLRTIVPLYWCMGVREILLGLLRGFGKSTGPMLMTLAGMIGIRQIYLYFTLTPGTSIQYLFYYYPIGWFSAMTLIFVYALFVRKSLKV